MKASAFIKCNRLLPLQVMASTTAPQDPFKRLSLAVRELDRLIDRANQLAQLSEQPIYPDGSPQPDQTTTPPPNV